MDPILSVLTRTVREVERTSMVERGTCPRCGNGELTHVVFGFPDDPDAWPAWMVAGGCIAPFGHDRRCEGCGHEWDAAERVVASLDDLVDALGCGHPGNIESSLESRYEDVMPVVEELHEHGLMIRVGTRAMDLSFPFTVPELWEALDDLEALEVES